MKRNESCEIWRKNERDKPVHLIKVSRERERERKRERSLLIVPLMQGFLNFPGMPPEKGENTII